MAKAPLCAICGKPQAEQFKPFCSARCADIDLNRWLKGNYAIPGKAVEEDDDETPQSLQRDDGR